MSRECGERERELKSYGEGWLSPAECLLFSSYIFYVRVYLVIYISQG